MIEIKEYNEIEEYKTLIVRRDRLKKEQELIYLNYIRTFGELLEKRFSLKIECIKIKKMISYYQTAINKGEYIDKETIMRWIDCGLEEYYDELKQLIRIKDCKGDAVSEVEFYKIKKLYYKIAMKVHPDVNPELFKNQEVVELWGKVQSAYCRNDYKELKEAEVLLSGILKKYKDSELSVEIEDIENKIAEVQREILEIINTDPYRYKYLLNDDDAVEEYKMELKEEVCGYEEYLFELEEALKEIEGKESLNS